MTTVELHLAFEWTCEECGRGNFASAVTLAPESIDRNNLPNVAGLDPEHITEWLDAGGQGDFMTAPTRVTCGHCGEKFDVEEAGA